MSIFNDEYNFGSGGRNVTIIFSVIMIMFVVSVGLNIERGGFAQAGSITIQDMDGNVLESIELNNKEWFATESYSFIIKNDGVGKIDLTSLDYSPKNNNIKLDYEFFRITDWNETTRTINQMETTTELINGEMAYCPIDLRVIGVVEPEMVVPTIRVSLESEILDRQLVDTDSNPADIEWIWFWIALFPIVTGWAVWKWKNS